MQELFLMAGTAGRTAALSGASTTLDIAWAWVAAGISVFIRALYGFAVVAWRSTRR